MIETSAHQGVCVVRLARSPVNAMNLEMLAAITESVDEAGRDVAPDDRQVGEILARGPTVTPGYWNRPEETAQAFTDGWLRTGDLAVVDACGFVNIVDRKKDVIITGGENVYSTEVEHALHEHPAVREVAVIGVPDEHWGETVKAEGLCRVR